MNSTSRPEWVTKGKTIRKLIEELRSFSDQDLPVMISTDNGETRHVISLVLKDEDACLLVNAESGEYGAATGSSY